MKEVTESSIKKWELGEAVFVAIAGTLLHFAYEWSGKNFFLGLFAPVNESVFEHLKLIWTPVLLFTLFQYACMKELRGHLLWVKGRSALAGVIFILVFYYSYTGMLQRNVAWLDIGSFYIAAALNSFLAYRMFKGCREKNEKRLWGVLLFGAYIMIMVLGTLYPPVRILPGLFVSPV